MTLRKNNIIAIALLCAIAFTGYAPSAHAQAANAGTIAALQAQLVALQAQLDAAKRSVANATVTADSEVEIAKITTSKKPTISGTADDFKKIYVTVTKEGADKPAYKKSVRVSNDAWKTRVSKNLPDGTYVVNVYGTSKSEDVLATKTFTAGKRSGSTSAASAESGSFSVSLVPLLMGGTARANQSVAISYIKVVNTSKESQTLTGVTLTQKGTAPASAVSSLTIKDDKDGSQGQVAVTGNSTTVPTTSVFAPGQMKLFTIKAVLAPTASAQLGKTLQYQVTGVTGGKGAFPIAGTTWTIGL
ncbi:MAG TPA: Ig-like domain-containing protein [Candidatus Paceibacterota bacterium]|nr:Ig-like domain-containing protein [Candidatus Paceibacterota bacterium]